jgi:GNAT superfamily N-acetyltransferase
MPQHLLLQLLLYMDFGGNPLYSLTTENCFAFKSNCALANFNRVCHANIISDNDIETIKAHFGTAPFAWFIDANDMISANILHEHKFIKYQNIMSGMSMNIASITANICEPEVTIKEIDQQQDKEKLIDIISCCFSCEKYELTQGINNLLTNGAQAVKLYLGFYKNKPCAAGIFIYHKNIVTLHCIGTLPEYRNKGIGSAITLYGLCDAADNGMVQALLLSSPMAQSLYKKIGFEEYIQYHIYLHKP